MGLLLKQLNNVMRDVTSLGGFIFYGFLLLIVLSLQEYSLFIKLLSGFLFTMLIVVLIRLIHFKPRPQKEQFNNLVEKIEASSFPSWHTARIFFLAFTFVYIFRNIFITVVLSVLTFLVAYSRIYLKKHDWKDVLGGLILGIITYILTTLW